MPRTVMVSSTMSQGSQMSRSRSWPSRSQNPQYPLIGLPSRTIDPGKVEKTVNNAVIGNPEEVAIQLKQRYHPDDRIMCWFDFFNHGNERVMRDMEAFMTKVVPIVNRVV